MIKASAALLVSPGTVVIEDVEFEGPGPGEIAVKMAAAGLCHTDLHIRDSSDGWGRTFPLLLGHEGSGIVTATGRAVSDLSPGDHVAIACRVPCGVCSMCSRGDPRRCRASAASPARIRRLSDGREVSAALGIGLFADQVVVDARAAVKMDPLVPLDVAGVFGCAVMTGVGAVTNTAKVFPGASVAVVGCGGIGLSVIQGSIVTGAGLVIAVDVVDKKLEWAQTLGATHTVNGSAEDPVQAVREITDGKGVDFAFEAVGSGRCVEQCLQMLAYGGTATVIGVPPAAEQLNIQLGGPSGFLSNTNSLLVTHGGDSLPRHDLQVFSQLLLQGRLDIENMISHRIKLTEIEHGFEMMRAGESIRSIVSFDDK